MPSAVCVHQGGAIRRSVQAELQYIAKIVGRRCISKLHLFGRLQQIQRTFT